MTRIMTAALTLLAISLVTFASWTSGPVSLTGAEMESIRGSDGSSARDRNYTCAEAECDNLNQTVTPPALPNVPSDICEDLDDFPCIDCGTNGKSLRLNNDAVNPGYTQPNPPTGVWCQSDRGRKGTCMNGFCINWVNYQCGIVIPNYLHQGDLTDP